jgi:hypothetical protein
VPNVVRILFHGGDNFLHPRQHFRLRLIVNVALE